MTGRRTAKVLLTLSQVGEMLGLHESQRVVQMYVTPAPHRLGLVIEGGDELPRFPAMPEHSWRDTGEESPIVYLGYIPQPKN